MAIYLCNNIDTLYCNLSLEYENSVNLNIIKHSAEDCFLQSLLLRIQTHKLHCQKANTNAHVMVVHTKFFNGWIIHETMIVLCVKMQKCLNNSPSKIAVIMYVLWLDGHCK